MAGAMEPAIGPAIHGASITSADTSWRLRTALGGSWLLSGRFIAALDERLMTVQHHQRESDPQHDDRDVDERKASDAQSHHGRAHEHDYRRQEIAAAHEKRIDCLLGL